MPNCDSLFRFRRRPFVAADADCRFVRSQKLLVHVSEERPGRRCRGGGGRADGGAAWRRRGCVVGGAFEIEKVGRPADSCPGFCRSSTERQSSVSRALSARQQCVDRTSTEGQPTKRQPIVNRALTAHQLSVNQASIKRQPSVNRASTECQSTKRQPSVGRASTECQPSVNRVSSTERQPSVDQLSVNRASTECRQPSVDQPSVNRASTKCEPHVTRVSTERRH